MQEYSTLIVYSNNELSLPTNKGRDNFIKGGNEPISKVKTENFLSHI